MTKNRRTVRSMHDTSGSRWHATDSRNTMDAQLHRHIARLRADATTCRGWHRRLPRTTQIALFDEPCIEIARRLEYEAAAIEADARSVS
jgi:hypothetical protein